jgi:AmmeMemoRadiSam system protein B
MACIESQSCEAFLAYLDETKNTICGRNPIILLLSALEHEKRAANISFIHYAQSGKIQDSSESSVSYASGFVEFE